MRQTDRPDLDDHLAANRQLAAKLIAQSRDPQRVYREFRREQRLGQTSHETTLELAYALADLVTGKQRPEDTDPLPTPELKNRAALMVCKLTSGPAPKHLWSTTRNHYTTCDDCGADIEFQTWACDKCRRSRTAA